MMDIDYNVRRADREKSKPRMQAEARLQRLARSMLESIHHHETKQKTVRKNDTSRTNQNSEVQKYFNGEIVRCGDPVIDNGCATQDVNSLSALQSECITDGSLRERAQF